MVFENISFIKPDVLYEKDYTKSNYAPLFRKKVILEQIQNAKLYVCGLGYGYYYINGKEVSQDKFTAPVSDYEKTLWYNVYDVSGLLKKGENVIAVWCGNGWYNEEFKTSWDYDQAVWRDLPKFILQLDVDGKTVAVSDESWKCSADSAVWFNALRSGEYFDARKYEETWTELTFDDSMWNAVAVDANPPKGVFRECLCEPIHEFEIYPAVNVVRSGEKKYVFDIGQNISGYIRMTVTGTPGQVLIIRYAEQVKEDNSLQLNQMDEHYFESEFQTDRFICSGRQITWSPKFTYHGFRYIEIEGLEEKDEIQVAGVFVHQAVEKRTEFQCSDEFLNRLFRAGQYSVYSNMFYSLTDCPSREKLGWANDAQSSAEQILTNFKVDQLFGKWLTDIYDAMDEKGAMPGIIPTSGWGFHWGNGPVSDGVLFELPYRLYLQNGNPKVLEDSRPYFRKYLEYLETREDAEGFVNFGLNDWTRPGQEKETGEPKVPARFINALLIQNFYKIAGLAEELFGGDSGVYKKKMEQLRMLIRKTWLGEDGRCRIHVQTAVAMLLYYNICENTKPLKQQLMELIEAADFHHDCGMVGLRRLYDALNQCGLEEYAYRILTAKGYPGYRDWFEQDATTLWEKWEWQDCHDSKNHHMYSDFMSWMTKSILGFRKEWEDQNREIMHVDPYYFRKLSFVKGSYEMSSGTVRAAWNRENDCIRLEIDVPQGAIVHHAGKRLASGKNVLFEMERE